MRFAHPERDMIEDEYSSYFVTARDYESIVDQFQDLLEQFYVISEPDMDSVDDILGNIAKTMQIGFPKRKIYSLT